jgi:hypothetical protein
MSEVGLPFIGLMDFSPINIWSRCLKKKGPADWDEQKDHGHCIILVINRRDLTRQSLYETDQRSSDCDKLMVTGTRSRATRERTELCTYSYGFRFPKETVSRPFGQQQDGGFDVQTSPFRFRSGSKAVSFLVVTCFGGHWNRGSVTIIRPCHPWLFVRWDGTAEQFTPRSWSKLFYLITDNNRRLMLCVVESASTTMDIYGGYTIRTLW